MKVFVTGATGFIGAAVAAALARRGHRVAGLARSEQAGRKLRELGYEAVAGTLTDHEALALAAREADAVVHAGATGDARNAEVDAAAVLVLLDALAGSQKRFIYTSGVWVYGSTGDAPADESTPFNPPALVAFRAAVEASVLDAADDIVTAIVRPGVVYGGRRGIPGMLLANREAVQVVGDGKNRWSLVHVDDLGELYALALENSPSGEAYNGGVESRTVRELALAAAASLGGVPLTFVPLEEARKGFGPFADALVLDQVISHEKARHTLGWTPAGPSIEEDYRLA
ncbi:MAG: NAD-dependent epimerase/dehydratase family protein [Candidatus Baltobacteraceae bacterium]|jgi:nucleoside-diphosphate-sugar epimerase